MRIDDISFYPGDGLNPSVPLASATTNPKRNLLFSFISLRQIVSQKVRIIGIIATIYSTLQNIFISFWSHLDLADKSILNKYDYIRKPLSFEENLTNILFFFSTEGSPKTMYIYSFVIFFTAILFFIISLTSFCLFFVKHRVNFPLLLGFNIFSQFICPIIIVPVGFQTGRLISRISFMNELKSSGESLDEYGSLTTFTVLTVLNVILFIILFFMIILINIFDTYSIFIVNSFFVSYNQVYQTLWMAAPSFILLLSNIMPLFHVNFRYFVISLHLIFCIYMTVMCFWFPSGKLFVNSIFGALSLSMLISDCLCFTSLNQKWYRYLIFLGCFFFFLIVMNILIKLRVKSILKPKGKEPSQEHSDHYKSNFTGFEELSESKLLFTLRIAMITKSEVFLDGKLADFISTRVTTNPDKIELSRLICYFPEFRSILFALLTALKRARFLSFLREYQLFQFRNYETACHSSARVDVIEGVVSDSKELAHQIRTLWQMLGTKPRILKNKYNHEMYTNQRVNNNNNNNISHNNNNSNNNSNYNSEDLRINNSNTLLSDQFLYGSYYSMSQSINHLENKWKAIISFYPNNIQVAHEYSKFLIECRGDFLRAAEWRTMSLLMKEGKVFFYNPVTISFLKAYPQYAKEIMYSKSNFLSSDDIDIHTKLANMENYIDMPETRFEYQRATNSAYPISIYLFLIIAIISLLFIIIFWVVGVNTFNRYKHITDNLLLIRHTALLSQHISKDFILAIMDYGQIPSINLTPTPDELYDCIYNHNPNKSDRVDDYKGRSLIELQGEYKSQIKLITEEGMDILHYLHNSTLEQIVQGNEYQSVLDVYFNSSIPNLYFLSKQESLETIEGLQSLIVTFFTYFYSISYSDNFSWVNDTFFYHAANAGFNALGNYEKMSLAFIKNDQYLIKLSSESFSTTMFIVCCSYFIISCILMWIDFCYIYNGFHKIVYTLQFFPKTVKLKAASPLIISNSNNADSEAINESMEVNVNFEDHAEINIHYQIKYTMYIYLIISSIINLILGGVIVAFYFVSTMYRKQFVSISNLVHNYSVETSSAIEVLYSVMACNVFGLIIPSIKDKYENRLLTAIQRFINTHEQCRNISIETDCGIKGQYADLINNQMNQEKCIGMENKSFHEIISCLGAEQEVVTFIDMSNQLYEDIKNPQVLKTELFMHYIHFVLSHIYYDVRNYTNYLIMAADDKSQDHISSMTIFTTFSIVVSIILFLFNVSIYQKFIDIFTTLFTFFSRLPPPDLVANDTVLDAFFRIKITSKSENENNETSFLVQESLPICFIDRATMIELVNNSFSSNFGFEANFIVGQPISTLIDDESILYLIDTMKYFGSQKSVVRTTKCKKGSGNKFTYDITFIPIKEIKKKNKKNDNNSDDQFVHRIALVFVDKTAEKNIQHKYKLVKDYVDKLIATVFPSVLQLFAGGYFNMCAICCIKLQNLFENESQANIVRVLNQRQNLYHLLFDKLRIYSLLHPLDVKNGVFSVVCCASNDPAELAIECLNYVFSVFNEYANIMMNSNAANSNLLNLQMSGNIFAVVETAGSLQVGWAGYDTQKLIVTGELIDRSMKVLENACLVGNICVTKKTYEYIMMHDYMFNERTVEDVICDSNILYSIDITSDKSYTMLMDSQSSHGSENESSGSSSNKPFRI